jgi:stage II sporulation protein D
MVLGAGSQAQAADWKIEGRGFGHGVGMSQYGAYDFARDGKTYRRILLHYYTDVSISNVATRNVRVLIAGGLGSIEFSSATEACGKNLNGNETYSFRLVSGKVTLRRPNGSELTGCGQEGAASGGRSVRFAGVGTYRGDLRARNVGGSLYAINRVGLQEYVQGVLPNELSPSWPQAALRAQAVAARSFALATRVNGSGYDFYDDARSQVYGGKDSETRSTNKAVRATSGEVIKSNGNVAAAYFFSSSGGQTENSEFGFSGGSPRAHLKSVSDPRDEVSPHHRWTARFSQAEMESRLSGLFGGGLKKIEILKTGRSPRIVEARVVGSNSSSTVSGDTLRFRLGLRSTWAKFRKI